MKQINWQWLTAANIGKIAAPLAPAIFLGWIVYEAAIARGIAAPLAIIGAVGIAIAIEAVGMAAGTNAVRFTVAGHWLALGSWAILAAYMAVGIYELWGTVFRFAFLFSFLAYLNAGISAIWERNAQAKTQATAEQKMTQAEEKAAERADKQAEAERAQQLKLAQLAAQKEVQLAKLTAATSRQDSGNLPQEKRQHGGNLQWDYTDWRLVPPEIKQKIATMTAPELAPIMPHLADTTRRSWVRKAKTEYGNLPPNSPYVAEQGASGD